MALFHFSVTQVRRSASQSVITSAAYRAGEKLYSEYYGETNDYTRKGGVIHTEIFLPPHAPDIYRDLATLWNAVEKSEKHPKAQLAYSFDIALQTELTIEENIALAREFAQTNFVAKGMIADLAVHAPDKEGGLSNPHFHVLTTMRPLNPDGSFAAKQRREYALDEHGNRIRDGDGKYVFNAVHTTDWHAPETLEAWRAAWCDLVNRRFEKRTSPAASITDPTRGRESTRFPPFTKDQTCTRWNPRASAPKRESSIAGSKRRTGSSATCAKRLLH